MGCGWVVVAGAAGCGWVAMARAASSATGEGGGGLGGRGEGGCGQGNSGSVAVTRAAQARWQRELGDGRLGVAAGREPGGGGP